MASCCCGLRRLIRSLIRSRNKDTRQSSLLTAKKVTVPVQCTDHDEPPMLVRRLGDGAHIHKTTGGLQLKRIYMVYE